MYLRRSAHDIRLAHRPAPAGLFGNSDSLLKVICLSWGKWPGFAAFILSTNTKDLCRTNRIDRLSRLCGAADILHATLFYLNFFEILGNHQGEVMGLHRLTVKTKLLASFGLLAAIVVALSGFAILALDGANAHFIGFVDGVNARVMLVNRIRAAVDRRALAARNLVLATTAQERAFEKAEAERAHEEVHAGLAELETRLAAPGVTDKARQLGAEIRRIENAYGPVALDIVKLAAEGQREAANQKINAECKPLLDTLVKAVKVYAGYGAELSQRTLQEAEVRAAWLRSIVIGASVAAVMLAVGLGLVITRSLLKALGTEPAVLNEITRKISAGDLAPIPLAQAAPKGSVFESMAAMQQSLAGIVGAVRGAANAISVGSAQIAAGNVDLSSRTEEQASSLQQTVSTMEQLTATVRQNADNARQANTLSIDASAVAQKGSAEVGQVVATMGDISRESVKIGEITGIIESIAFQTNILALNAAVEAARAGEQGRGFAVVASEVRTLAQRSSSAAKDIKELIGASLEKITTGSGAAEQAGRTMQAVTLAVEKVTAIIHEITQASEEQTSGIEQISHAMGQMDQVTQHNAALVEQAAAASQSLEQQGRELDHAVASFRLA